MTEPPIKPPKPSRKEFRRAAKVKEREAILAAWCCGKYDFEEVCERSGYPAKVEARYLPEFCKVS